jgi:hypothetical protein
MQPGQTATAINKTYFVESTLAAWHRRMKQELAG